MNPTRDFGCFMWRNNPARLRNVCGSSQMLSLLRCSLFSDALSSQVLSLLRCSLYSGALSSQVLSHDRNNAPRCHLRSFSPITRNVCETCNAPHKLKCHCDLDLWPRNSKFNRVHLLVMTNHHIKLEDPWAIKSLVIDRTRYVYGLTDRHYVKQYPQFFEGGGGIIN